MPDSTLTGESLSIADALEQWISSLGSDVAPGEATLWLVVLASVALDICTTFLGLSAGIAEGNPIMRWAINGYGFGALVVAKALVVGGAGLLREARPGYGRTIALGLAVPWVLTVIVNIGVLATL